MMIELVDQATMSVLVQAAGLAIIAGIQKSADAKRDRAKADTDAKRAKEAEWRESMERRMDSFERLLEAQDDKIDSVLKSQLTQTRSDIVHKSHRYLDDLGCASIDEKSAYDAQYREYTAMCEAYGIENEFVTHLHEQVMALPGRDLRPERVLLPRL